MIAGDVPQIRGRKIEEIARRLVVESVAGRFDGGLEQIRVGKANEAAEVRDYPVVDPFDGLGMKKDRVSDLPGESGAHGAHP